MAETFFAGFETRRIEIGETDLSVTTGGAGPPVLLLHGFPQTHLAWHRVAPALAERFSLVIPDLPGYGASRGPAADPGHINYAKRSVAATMAALMESLGHPKFDVAGHDRGARVGYRLALDASERVGRMATLDVVPTLDTWAGMDWAAAVEAFHWPFLAQPAPLPERMIGADPEAFYGRLLDSWAGGPDALAPEARQAYLDQFKDPAVIEATCEDYRAGAGIDRELDLADYKAGRKLACPVLILRGKRYQPEPMTETWRRWADAVEEIELDCGHFIAEEEPEATAEALVGFFSG